MNAIPLATPRHPSPWLTMWLHPCQTIQWIIDTNPRHHIVLLILLSGIAVGMTDWLQAVVQDSDTFQESALLAIGFRLFAGTVLSLAACVVLQWIAGWSKDRIPYSHLVAATFWSTVPQIGFLLLLVVIFVAAPLTAALVPSAAALLRLTDLLLLLAGLVAQIWVAVLEVGALSQVMQCSVGTAIGRGILAGLILAIPAWALYTLATLLTAGYSGNDIVIYQASRPGTASDLVSFAVPVAVLVVAAVVLLAIYRASRRKMAGAAVDGHPNIEAPGTGFPPIAGQGGADTA